MFKGCRLTTYAAGVYVKVYSSWSMKQTEKEKKEYEKIYNLHGRYYR